MTVPVTVNGDFTIRVIDGAEAESLVPALAGLIIDAVESGSSVTFLAPLARDKAEAYWRSVAQGVTDNERILLVAFSGDRVAGSLQAIFCGSENQGHRAEVAKMMVHRDFRRQGLASALLLTLESLCAQQGKYLLNLDTELGCDAERLYRKLGWIEVGKIPEFAVKTDGTMCTTVIFYKNVQGKS